MSFFDKIDINFPDSQNLDPAGRLRISTPYNLLELVHLYDKVPEIVDELANGSASSTYVSDGSIDLEIGNSSGDRIVRQTKQYVQYQPGKPVRILMTGVLNTVPTTGIRSRLGFFDNKDDKTRGQSKGNGIFFELDGNDLSCVIRKTDPSTGTQSDIKYLQTNWNIDKFDGTGPSGITLDVTKNQLFVMDFLWQGGGRVRFGFLIGGRIHYCHIQEHANALDTTFMNTPCLPIRYEIENTNGVAFSGKMKQICASVVAEGNLQGLYQTKTVDRGTSILSVGNTLQPILSLRTQALYNRVGIQTTGTSVTSISNNRNIRWALYQGTSLTSASWTPVTNTVVEKDISASAVDVSNATLISSGYVIAEQSNFDNVNNEISAWADIQGNSDILTLAAQTITGSGDVIGSLKFKEIT